MMTIVISTATMLTQISQICRDERSDHVLERASADTGRHTEKDRRTTKRATKVFGSGTRRCTVTSAALKRTARNLQVSSAFMPLFHDALQTGQRSQCVALNGGRNDLRPSVQYTDQYV